MTIKTERLLIRPVEAEDWRDFQAIWEDYSRSPYARLDQPCNTEPEAVQAQIARWAAEEDPARRCLAVCLGERVIGYLVCFLQEDGSYELGYCFHSAFHRRGYARQSLTAVLEALRGEGVKRVLAGTGMENLPSVGLLRSLGFQLTRTEPVSFYRDAQGAPIYFEGGWFEKQL